MIPCYRSELTIEKVVDEIEGIFPYLQYDYEIVLVSDHSPDNVFSKIKELAQNNYRVKGIEFTKNFGQHAALMAGYRASKGDIIVSLDDDGQTPADESPRLIEKVEQGYDVVYGSYAQKQDSFFRNFGSKINSKMTEFLIGKPKDLQITSFFAMTKTIRDEIIRYKEAYPYVMGLVLRSSASVCNVPVSHRVRSIGKSGYSLKKLFALWLNGFTAFSVKPLRLATWIGFTVAVIGFVFGIYTIIHKFIYPSTPAGYSTIVSLLLFIGGLIMIMLGMIGEYIGRIYICINGSPQYVIREVTRNNKS